MKTKGIILLCALFQLTSSASNNANQVIGCFDASISDYNYQAIITDDVGSCGGAIVSTTYVLTLARCVRTASISDIHIRVGSTNTHSGGIVFDVSTIILHPKANEQRSEYNAALIKLSTELKISSTISPIILANKVPAEGTNVVISGFDFKAYFGKESSLQASFGSTQSIFSCYNAASGICANTSTCVCNIGNPLVTVHQKQLVGLLSANTQGFCLLNVSLIYLSVGPISDWVKNVIKSK